MHKPKDGGVDLLAFGPHPDDVELNIGGILALHATYQQVVIIDLSAGELASNGTVLTRSQESQDAANILGVKERTNLNLPDGGINPYDVEQQKLVVEAIRRYRPRTVLLPYWQDRHPDHQEASRLIEVGIFKSGLKKYAPEQNLSPYRPQYWYYYLQHQNEKPQLIVDISAVYEQKISAIQAYVSQFSDVGQVQTFINQPVFLQKIKARDEYFGGMIQTHYGEGLISKKPISLKNLSQLNNAD